MGGPEDRHKGNIRKEGLGFEGHRSNKAKPKKITKEKLVSVEDKEHDKGGHTEETGRSVAKASE